MSAMSPSTSPRLSSMPSSTSPPKTPVENKLRTLGSPPSDDSSIIEDLSFDYVFDNDGEFVRLSRGSSSKSNHSSPPTPPDNLPQPSDSHLKPSPVPVSRRLSLTRSESAHLVTSGTAHKSEVPASRSFQRVASGSALLNNKARPLPRRVAMEESNKHRPVTRVTRTVELLPHEKENLNTDEQEQAHEHHPARIPPSRTGYARSSALDGQQRIIPGLHRPGRVMMSTSSSSSALRSQDYSIPETHGVPPVTPEVENEADEDAAQLQIPSSTPFPSSNPLSDVQSAGDTEVMESSPPPIPVVRQRSYGVAPSHSAREAGFPSDVGLSLSTSTRPRRSASLSDALNHEAGYGHHQRQQLPEVKDEYLHIRSSTAANESAAGPRRVTLEEREREIRKYRREEVERKVSHSSRLEVSLYIEPGRHVEQDHQESQHDLGQQQPVISAHRQYGHRRRDSDTLKSMPLSAGLGSPTVVEAPRVGGASPSGASKLGRATPPGTKVGRVSPPGKVSPSGFKTRASPPLVRIGHASSSPVPRPMGRVSPAPSTALSTHRRSPTASEAMLKDGSQERSAKTYSMIEREDELGVRNERESREDHREQPALEQPQQVRAAPLPPTHALQRDRNIIVNKRMYARLDMIGKGGSSRVFRVLDLAHSIYAIKKVALDKTDAETMSGYMNEIALLKRLAGNSRIIRLIDSEVRPGPGGSKGSLLLVMECGETDLARLISEAVHEPLDMIRVAGYWKQMLQAVHVIHEEKIVHSDLKPANFVIVKGQLKLIDFGIANAIANDTTNIQRDHQIGTVNYMSPEAIELPDGMRRLKVGRPSDIWSLGCILYQMIYGCTPFQHLNVYQKMKAIPDPNHIVDFPEYSSPLAPSARGSNGAGGAAPPPKRLDNLKTKVKGAVIDTIKSCLLRNPKERATIPDLLNQNWLAMTDPELAADETVVKLAPGETVLKLPAGSTVARSASGDRYVRLGPEETIISPYYMRQLLQYGIKLGKDPDTDQSEEHLLREAQRLVAELKSLQPMY